MVPRSSLPALRGPGTGAPGLGRPPRTPLALGRAARTALRTAVCTAVVLVAGAVVLPALPTPAARAAEEPLEPLAVTIEELTPGELPRRGSIQVSGTVTNVDDETWTTVNLYPVIGSEPLTTAPALREAVASDPLAYVGDRVTDPGPYAVVDRLEPGESATYAFSVARSRLDVTERGVYWFGVHALGQGPDGRDTSADGRARTFLPLVSVRGERTGSLPVSVVVPLRRRIVHEPDGSVADPVRWADELGPGGRLRRLVDLGTAAGDLPVTWLVDPALLETAARLAAGNPGRSLEPTVDPEEPDPDADPDGTSSPSDGDGTGGTGPGGGASDEPSGTAGTSPSASPATPTTPPPVDPDELEPELRAAALAAEDWLEALDRAVTSDDQVLALPYGDVDVAGAAEHDPALYEQARRRSGGTLPPLGIEADPGLASPLGFLDQAALDVLDQEETVLLTDAAVPTVADGAGGAPVTAAVAGREVVLSSSGAARGGPGPGERRSTTGLRQRVLAEAAVRLLSRDQHPLVVVLPLGWSPEDPEAFASALRTGWVDADTVEEVTAGAVAEPVAAEDLRYPEGQQAAELGAERSGAAQELVASGQVLQDVLTLNDQVGAVVAGEAYTATSYTTRPVRRRAARELVATSGYLQAQLGSVRVTTPTGVTLSSESGRLPVTLVNDLDQPVTVALDARSDLPMTLNVPEGGVEVPPGSRVGVLLGATTQREGVHNVTLLVTSVDGALLGGRAELPIRSAQVSNVIWLIMGTGAVLLFGMIGLRLTRRIREARASTGGATGDATGDAAADSAGGTA